VEILEQNVQQLQKNVEEITGKLAEDSSEETLNTIREKVESLEKNTGSWTSAIESLQQKIESLESDLAAAQQTITETIEEQQGASAEEATEEHRLFSYIEDPQEREKVQQLVLEALDKEMTYAQTADHVAENVSPATAKIIADHPALTKEFIRDSRK
jgi:prefoldin subunit 5